MSVPYVAVRDDAGMRSLSTNERDFLRSCALSGLRGDGRRKNDIRKAIRLQLGRWDNGAECTLQWGVGTRVTSLCSAELVPPNPDRPNEGMLNFTVDLSPMAGTDYRLAPPVSTAPSMSAGSNTRGPNHSDQDQRLLSNRILRCIEKIILVGGALDTEALALMPGKWVWRFNVALTVLDDGGNILDACVLASMAALRHYRKPQVDISGIAEGDNLSSVDPPLVALPTMIPSIVKEATPLPLHHTPLSVSFALIPADDVVNSASSTSKIAVLVDPTDREELVKAGTLTIALNVHSEVCLLDYSGGCELDPSKLKDCCKIAVALVKQLCTLLETALEEADDQAQRERLLQLQSRQQEGQDTSGIPPQPTGGHVPFFQDSTDADMDVEMDDTIGEGVDYAESRAEEEYRLLALDFTKGHVATAVREDSERENKLSMKKGGSLLGSMLKSARIQTVKLNDGAQAESITTPTIGENTSPDNAPAPDESLVTVNESKVAEMSRDSDDEDEESPIVLRREFESLGDQKAFATSPPPSVSSVQAVEVEDITDLAMAVKKKKKKTKPKKK